jgi:hypothetical protein
MGVPTLPFSRGYQGVTAKAEAIPSKGADRSGGSGSAIAYPLIPPEGVPTLPELRTGGNPDLTLYPLIPPSNPQGVRVRVRGYYRNPLGGKLKLGVSRGCEGGLTPKKAPIAVTPCGLKLGQGGHPLPPWGCPP